MELIFNVLERWDEFYIIHTLWETTGQCSLYSWKKKNEEKEKKWKEGIQGLLCSTILRKRQSKTVNLYGQFSFLSNHVIDVDSL